MTRVTDLSAQNASLALLRQTTARIDKTVIQVSSGRVSETYAGISRDAARVVNLQTDQARASQYASDNKLIGTKLTTMESKVASLVDLATSVRTQLVAALGSTNPGSAGIQTTAGGALETVAATLNSQLDGKSLFAGSRTDTLPVDLSGRPADGVFAGDAAATYYKGDDKPAQATVADGQTLTYGIGADDPAFASLIQGLQMAKAANGNAADGGASQLQAALDLVNKALETLPDVRSRIGASQNVVDAATTRHTTFVTFATQAVGDIQNVDAAQALTQLSSDQAVLQASYAAIGRLTSLSIIDYLK